MAAYCTARALAEKLGQTEVFKLLQKTYEEEEATDEKLKDLLVSEIVEEQSAAR